MALHDDPAQLFISERSHKPEELDSAGHPATAPTDHAQSGAPRLLRVQLVRAYHDELVQIRAKRGRCVGPDTSHAKALAVRAPCERDTRPAAPVVTRIVRQSGDNTLVVGDASARAAAKLSGPIRAAHGSGNGLEGRSTSSTNSIALTTGSSATCAIAMAESRARAVAVVTPRRLRAYDTLKAALPSFIHAAASCGRRPIEGFSKLIGSFLQFRLRRRGSGWQ